ncbi:MAG: hypothetical protein AB1733_11775 [Thermodesulfobacteriota bacterium]
MAIAVTYVAADQFSVSGDRTNELKKGLTIKAVQGVDGSVESAVVSSSYDAGRGFTTCTIAENCLTPNLVSIQHGLTYADPDNCSSNLARHLHTSAFDGGYLPAATLSEAEVEAAKSLPVPATGDANKIIRVLPTENGYRKVSLNGTANQVTITHNVQDTTISLPQDFDTGASPVLAGITLTGLTGILEGRGSSPLASIASSDAYHVLRRNSTNTAYEFSQPFAIHGTAGESLSQFDAVYLDVVSERWMKAQSGSTAQKGDVWGIVTEDGGITIGSDGEILLFGFVTNQSWTWTPGDILYLSQTAGEITSTEPTNAAVIGHAITDTTIFFLPKSFSGDVGPSGGITGTAGEDLSVCDVVYADYTNSGRYKKATNNATSLEAAAVGIAQANITEGASGPIQLFGTMTNGAWSWIPGKSLYVSDTPGALIQYEPSAYGRYVKPVGYAVSATEIWIFPQSGWQVGSSSSGGGGALPDYCPPAMKYKDSDEIIIPKGRYYRLGHRIDGQYQDLNSAASYWDLAASLEIDVDAPGTMIGGDVASSWYSVFLTGEQTALVLPFIRAKTVFFSDPNTIISPANHDDGTTGNNNFLSADDELNGYRLVLLSNTVSHYGKVFTISDCVNGTPDQICISGDQTPHIQATDWLQTIPPQSVPSLYLGSIRLDSSGNIVQFYRTNWQVQYASYIQVAGVLNTTESNTDLGAAVPPTAKKLQSHITINSGGGTNAAGMSANIYSGTAGTNLVTTLFYASTTAHVEHRMGMPFDLLLTAVASMRNKFLMHNGTAWVAATEGYFRICGFEE